MNRSAPHIRKAILALAVVVVLSALCIAMFRTYWNSPTGAASWGAIVAPAALGAALMAILNRLATARLLLPLKDIADAAQQLERGNLASDIPHTEDTGVSGDLARRLSAIRSTLASAKARGVASTDSGKIPPADPLAGSVPASDTVKATIDALATLARGDLTVRIKAQPPAATSPDDEALHKGFNQAASALQERIRDMGKSIDAVRDGASDIQSAAEDLVNRADSQSENLERSVTVLAHLTETVQGASDRLDQAETVTRESRAQAESGAAVVREAMDAMHRIEASSENVRHVVGVIDGIAFQTNLLALNAGVEAARAGEAGKGFAVVASEVRSLAQRASKSAKEIKGLIDESATQVNHGSKLVTTSGERLEAILENTIRFENVISDISGVARDQRSDIREINDHVGQLDASTKAAVSIAEQVTAASSVLTKNTDELARGLSGITKETGRAEPPVRQASRPLAPQPKPSPLPPRKAPDLRPVPGPPARLPDPPAAVAGSAAAALPSLSDFDGF
ncbi:methyl-accepting chemotaxis protein [Roseovarius indicus]|uniref:Dipeptide chemoreceptor protein n=1 Tax=Roseovarius indicus TaxID=540747 RepID=A0A5P3AC78_9RHOB|nr:methyl-accepting chemotaxis protein [Roseovarius indicus]QEW26190.1 Dipeptide chemoreceptor protein [Roseovarius indicus]SFD94642.1 methyl-accepting chemotaxis protein [Roseovarius indicus]